MSVVMSDIKRHMGRRGAKGEAEIKRLERRRLVAKYGLRNMLQSEIWAELQRIAKEENKPHLAVTKMTICRDHAYIRAAVRAATVERGIKIREDQAAKVFAVEGHAYEIFESARRDGDRREMLAALDTLLKCNDRISKLYGAEAPTKLEVAEVSDEITVKIVDAREVDRLMSANGE